VSTNAVWYVRCTGMGWSRLMFRSPVPLHPMDATYPVQEVTVIQVGVSPVAKGACVEITILAGKPGLKRRAEQRHVSRRCVLTLVR
jgi:hypothetical protein